LKEGEEEKPTKTRTLLALVRARSGGRHLFFLSGVMISPGFITVKSLRFLNEIRRKNRVPQLRSSLEKSHHQLDNMNFSPNKKQN